MRWMVLLLVAGCGLFHEYVPPQPGPTPEELFNRRWVGRPEDDVLLQYGQPDAVLTLSNGNRVASYRREVFVSSGRSAFGQYGGGSRSDATTIYCDRRFEIDKTTSAVVRAVITGSSCDYNR